MILAIDTETYVNKDNEYTPVLDCQEFILGGILTDKGKMIYSETPNEMVNNLMELIEKEKKRGGKTYIYAHNMQYDFYAMFRDYLKKNIIVEIGDKQIKYFSFYPFIALYGIYKENEKFDTYAWFLDTTSYFKGCKLEELGKYIGLNKLDMPKRITNNEELKEYLKRDCEIVMKSMEKIKEITEKMNMKIRRYISASNTAMSCFMTYCEKNKINRSFSKNRKIYKGEHIDKLRGAYRGGRLECFKIGEFDNCHKIDCNSMYPYIMKEMKFPMIRNEIYIEGERCESHLDNIGVVKCEIKVGENLKYGYLPIRYKDMTYYPKGGVIYGIWTTLEVRKAIKLGYKVLKYDYGVFYGTNAINPFKCYMDVLYKKKKESLGIEREVYKLLMNSLYGKFAQERANQEYKIINRSELKKYEILGYKFIKTAGEKYIIERKGEKQIPRFGNVLISIWITANARDFLYEQMMKIPKDDLIYVSTDCLIMKNVKSIFDLGIKIGDEMGEFKLEDSGKCIIMGENKYEFNKKIRLGGVPRNQQSINVLKGIEKVKINKIITVKKVLSDSRYNGMIGNFEEKENIIMKRGKFEEVLPMYISEVN